MGTADPGTRSNPGAERRCRHCFPGYYYQRGLPAVAGRRLGAGEKIAMRDILARITISRLTLYFLALLALLAIALATLGLLPYSPADMVFSTLLVLVSCWAANAIFAHSFGAHSNLESMLITALILVLIITPFAPRDYSAIGFAIFACSWAMASKYMLPPGGRHIFNPAAFGVALAAA